MKVMVVVMICVITFIILASLMGGWGRTTNSFIDALFNFFTGSFGG